MSILAKQNKDDVFIRKRNRKLKYKKKIKGTFIKDFSDGLDEIGAWIAKIEHQKFYDIFVNISYVVMSIISLFFIYEIYNNIKYLHLDYALRHIEYKTKLTPIILFLIVYSIFIWFVGIMGDFSKMPHRRLWYLNFTAIYILILLTAFYSGLLSMTISNILSKYININQVSQHLLYGTVRQIIIPIILLIILPVAYLYFTTVYDKELKELYMAFEIWRLLPNIEKVTPNSCRVRLCIDRETGKDIFIGEKKQKEHVLIASGSGGGKTSQVLKPIIAEKLELKYKLREEKKRVAIECLKKGWAYLTEPVDNEWFSKNFNMELIQPYPDYRDVYLKVFKEADLIYGVQDNGKIIYRDLGMFIVSPDGGLATDVLNLADNFNIHVKYIDPDPIKRDNSRKIWGINPMLSEDHNKVANVISSVLYEMMYDSNAKTNPYFPQMTQRALQNTILLLLKSFPALNGGKIPSIYNILSLFVNPADVEPYMDYIKENLDADDYKLIVDYFFTSFMPREVIDGQVNYNNPRGSNRKKVQEALEGARAQLDNLLRMKSVREILCADSENTAINLKKSLENGDIIVLTTRAGYLSNELQKAFANFIILTIKNEGLSRYAEEENPEIPFYEFYDEGPFYINSGTEEKFTFSRKYQISVYMVLQGLAQLDDKVNANFRKIIIDNTDTKILFGKMSGEDAEFWEKELGYKIKWKEVNSVRETPILEEKANRMHTTQYIQERVPKMSADDIRNSPFGTIIYKATDIKGKTIVGKGMVRFLEDYYTKQVHDYDVYDFNMFYDKKAGSVYRKERKKIEEERKRLLHKLNNTEIVKSSKPVDDIGDEIFDDIATDKVEVSSNENNINDIAANDNELLIKIQSKSSDSEDEVLLNTSNTEAKKVKKEKIDIVDRLFNIAIDESRSNEDSASDRDICNETKQEVAATNVENIESLIKTINNDIKKVKSSDKNKYDL